MDFLASLLAFSKSPSTLREFWARRRHRWASSRLDSISHTTLNHPSVAKVDFKEVQLIFNLEELRHMSHNFFQAGWRVLNSLKLVRNWSLVHLKKIESWSWSSAFGDFFRWPFLVWNRVSARAAAVSFDSSWSLFLQSGLQLQQRLAALQQWSRKPDSKKGLGCLGEGWAALQKCGERDVI